jgi:hypothetical protein
VGHASRSSGLLDVEASLARVSQSGLKTGGGAMTGGPRGTIGFQFLLEEPLFFYFDSRVLGKALCRWITGHVLEPPEQRA